jgi:outer membrane biogenesis lipoprotein LolB
MRFFRTMILASAVVALAACSTPEERAAKAQQGAAEAQEEVARERLDLVAKYQDCVEEAAGDNQKIEACDSYLKAAEALQ